LSLLRSSKTILRVDQQYPGVFRKMLGFPMEETAKC
jgi:hypothetical protein